MIRDRRQLRDRARVLTRLETPLRVSVRSPYYAGRWRWSRWCCRWRRWTRKRAGYDGRDGAAVREPAVSRRL
jgi:hypothetical protein